MKSEFPNVVEMPQFIYACSLKRLSFKSAKLLPAWWEFYPFQASHETW